MPTSPTHRPFDLVMFDLDGTLIETAPEICDAVNDTLQALALPLVSQTQVNDWIGHGTRTLLVQALAWSQGLTEAAVRASDSLAGAAAVFDQFPYTDHVECGVLFERREP